MAVCAAISEFRAVIYGVFLFSVRLFCVSPLAVVSFRSDRLLLRVRSDSLEKFYRLVKSSVLPDRHRRGLVPLGIGPRLFVYVLPQGLFRGYFGGSTTSHNGRSYVEAL